MIETEPTTDTKPYLGLDQKVLDLYSNLFNSKLQREIPFFSGNLPRVGEENSSLIFDFGDMDDQRAPEQWPSAKLYINDSKLEINLKGSTTLSIDDSELRIRLSTLLDDYKGHSFSDFLEFARTNMSALEKGVKYLEGAGFKVDDFEIPDSESMRVDLPRHIEGDENLIKTLRHYSQGPYFR